MAHPGFCSGYRGAAILRGGLLFFSVGRAGFVFPADLLSVSAIQKNVEKTKMSTADKGHSDFLSNKHLYLTKNRLSADSQIHDRFIISRKV